jgi:hypothetical protein
LASPLPKVARGHSRVGTQSRGDRLGISRQSRVGTGQVFPKSRGDKVAWGHNKSRGDRSQSRVGTGQVFPKSRGDRSGISRQSRVGTGQVFPDGWQSGNANGEPVPDFGSGISKVAWGQVRYFQMAGNQATRMANLSPILRYFPKSRGDKSRVGTGQVFPGKVAWGQVRYFQSRVGTGQVFPGKVARGQTGRAGTKVAWGQVRYFQAKSRGDKQVARGQVSYFQMAGNQATRMANLSPILCPVPDFAMSPILPGSAFRQDRSANSAREIGKKSGPGVMRFPRFRGSPPKMQWRSGALQKRRHCRASTSGPGSKPPDPTTKDRPETRRDNAR